MSAEENKAAVRRFLEGVNRGDLSAVDQFVTDDVVYHHAPPGLAAGKEGYRQLMSMYLTAFPDLHLTVEDLVCEGDRVAARLSGRGTHRGDLMGIAPTGKTVAADSITIMRFAGGKLAEEWEQVDLLGILQQIGAVPAPGQPQPAG
jgi:steroid delta-isomerase-like uncharacterized protein